MAIDDVRAWFVAQGWGIDQKERLFYERMAGLMDEGEALESVFLATHQHRGGHAVLTSKRIVHLAPAAGGLTATVVDRADVTEAKFGGLIVHTLTIRHRGGKLVLVAVPKVAAKATVAALGC